MDWDSIRDVASGDWLGEVDNITKLHNDIIETAEKLQTLITKYFKIDCSERKDSVWCDVCEGCFPASKPCVHIREKLVVEKRETK